jgi:hypothetical protein
MTVKLEVPQDATVQELIDMVADALPSGNPREFRLAVEARLDRECPFVEALNVAKSWGVLCVPGERLRP